MRRGGQSWLYRFEARKLAVPSHLRLRVRSRNVLADNRCRGFSSFAWEQGALAAEEFDFSSSPGSFELLGWKMYSMLPTYAPLEDHFVVRTLCLGSRISCPRTRV